MNPHLPGTGDYTVSNAKKLNRRLTSLDAAFLYSESHEVPMHIGGLEVLEGRLDPEKLMAAVDAKLHHVPRYRQVVTPAPFGLGHPTWEDDQKFDIRNHVLVAAMPKPGTEEQFQDTASELFEGVLDRSQPLWSMTIIKGRQDGNTGLLWKVHHAMVDGVSGAELLSVVLDAQQDATVPEKPDFQPDAHPQRNDLMRDAGWDTLQNSFDHAGQFGRKVADLGRGVSTNNLRANALSAAKIMRDFTRPLVRLPFNAMRVSGKRRLSWSHISFAEVRGIRRVHDCTVNDVVLAALAGGVRKYMQAHNINPRRKTFRAACPVSLRSQDQSGALGNLVSMMPVDVAMTDADPVARLLAISERTEMLKSARIPNVLDLFNHLWQASHPLIQSMAAGAAVSKPLTAIADRFRPRPVAHMVCTNVPGPQVPLFAAGHRVLHHYPLLPVGPGMALNMGVFSYNQRIYFGYIADTFAMKDTDFFRDCVDEAFAELREACGVPVSEHIDIRHPKPMSERKGIDEETAAEILERAKEVAPKPRKKKAAPSDTPSVDARA